MKHNAWDLKGEVIGQLPECQWSVYENDRTVDHVVTGHLWDSRYRVGQWTMWLRATSGIPATAVDHRC